MGWTSTELARNATPCLSPPAQLPLCLSPCMCYTDTKGPSSVSCITCICTLTLNFDELSAPPCSLLRCPAGLNSIFFLTSSHRYRSDFRRFPGKDGHVPRRLLAPPPKPDDRFDDPSRASNSQLLPTCPKQTTVDGLRAPQASWQIK